jgi:transcriptional regulator with XRE-family HTH domain
MGREQASERLRAWRAEARLTLAQVAEQLGCSDAWLSLIERGLKVPGSMRLALAIQEATGIAASAWPEPEPRKRRVVRAKAA